MPDKHSEFIKRNPDARNDIRVHEDVDSTDWARIERNRRSETLRLDSLDESGHGIVDWERSFHDEATENSRRYWANLPDPSSEPLPVDNDRYRFDLRRLLRRVWVEFRQTGR